MSPFPSHDPRGKRHVDLEIINSHGLDDLGSMIDFLVETTYWEKETSGGTIKTVGFHNLKGRKESIISTIEEKGKEEELKQLVVKIWNEIETKCKVKRKSKYGE